MDDESEFVMLFREHYTAVRRFIERRVSDPQAADDLTMDCFEIAWRKRTPDHPFGLAWLYRTARNLIGNEYRRREREGALWAHIEDHVRTLSVEAGSDLTARLLDAVRALPEREREILWLTYWEELPAAEVAVVLDLKPGAVWTRLNRARARLKPLLVETSAAAERREEVRDDR
ncbi:DNA-directed RNA polymerase specialized sigma subunit, sigma24 homolog [Microbacterium testaceum StLB037]|uniref:DNA-directed RNA polymerase specialized sigma subunit, sigma24 homolog n=1 Tax=Microbacterium testaceum (strain StLB037) TaxID=979556 RepID=E8NGR8_MICTS|nr:sigma-70 family RNA polymerase sigma factor [Microbacterium testaceum]BAJ75367.1 DNA-directed RNA polymerase specialized sigma subunit, sigma24 homolog [Microbacterium testaceum StLB037]